MLAIPSAAAWRCAASTIASEKSLTTTRPLGATAAAAAKANAPVPAAISSTVSPDCRSSRSSIRSDTGRAASSKYAWRSSQPAAILSHTAWLARL
jgi:hypothetical protein